MTSRSASILDSAAAGTPFDTAGTVSSGMLITPNASNPGHLNRLGLQATDLTGAGTLINLKFMIVGTPGGSHHWPSRITDRGRSSTQGSASMPARQQRYTSNGGVHVNGPTAAGTEQLVVASLTIRGQPLSGTVVRLNSSQSRKTITDVNGVYHFDNVTAADFYTVTPTRANYAFNPGQRSFSVLGNRTEASFTALFNGETTNPLDTAEYFVRQHTSTFSGANLTKLASTTGAIQINACNADARCLATPRHRRGGSVFH